MIPELGIAALNCLEAYLKFLCTPEGQAFAADQRKLILDPLVALIPPKLP